jgi:hypothetical protein
MRRRVARRQSPVALDAQKLDLIDLAADRLGCASFVDLGGLWGVSGGYSVYAATAHNTHRVVLVDDDLHDRGGFATPDARAVRERAAGLVNLELLAGTMGEQRVREAIGHVDCVLFFDVLMHQVAPDWDELLAAWAPHTRAFAIVHPAWDRPEEVVRLTDLAREEYLRLVPPLPLHDELYDRLDAEHTRRGRPWRDSHDVWQWGIGDRALGDRLADLGFRTRLYADHGSWNGLPRFRKAVLIASRD